MKSKVNTQKVKAFFKKYMYYMIMGVCIIAIGAMITVAAVVGGKDNSVPEQSEPGNTVIDPPVDDTPIITPPDNSDNQPVVSEPDPIVFGMPVASGTVIKDYAMDTIVWSSTLKQYQVHNGIDIAGEAGSKVVCVYDGVVDKVSYDALNGYVVSVNHGDGLKTTYSSLADPAVQEGQIVKQGTELGTISTSATAEMSDGSHVHFAVFMNEAAISPYSYLPTGDK